MPLFGSVPSLKITLKVRVYFILHVMLCLTQFNRERGKRRSSGLSFQALKSHKNADTKTGLHTTVWTDPADDENDVTRSAHTFTTVLLTERVSNNSPLRYFLVFCWQRWGTLFFYAFQYCVTR